MSYHRRLSMMMSSRHKPEIACVVKSTTLRHWNIAKKWFSKISIIQRFLFDAFAGKKQPKQARKMPVI